MANHMCFLLVRCVYFIVRIVLEEGTKTRLVLGREIQESPIFIVTLLS